METLITMIANLGFPIACAVMMFLGIKYQFDNDRQERIEQDKRYDDISKNVQTLCSAVNNNTEAISKLIEKIEVK